MNALLEVESGLNDPMSVVLMVALVQLATNAGRVRRVGDAALLLASEEMGGGVVLGLAGGWALLRRAAAHGGRGIRVPRPNLGLPC